MPNGAIDAAFTRDDHWYWPPVIHNSCALLRVSLQGRRPDSIKPRSRILYHLYMRRLSSMRYLAWPMRKSFHDISNVSPSIVAGSPGQSSLYNKQSCDSEPSSRLAGARLRIRSITFHPWSERRVGHAAHGGCTREDGCRPVSYTHLTLPTKA